MTKTLGPALVALALGVLAFGAGELQAQEKKRDIEIKASKAPELAPRKKVEQRRAPKLDAERFVRKKTEAVAEEKWQEAFSLLRKLIAATDNRDPAKPDLFFRLSEMFWEKASAITIRGFDAEERCLKNASSPAVEKQCVGRREQAQAESEGLREKAIKVYRHIVTKFPRYPRLDGVLFALAYNYQQKKAPEKAKKIYIELIKRYPQSVHVPDTLLNVGEIFFDAGQVDQALKAYRKVTTNYQDSDVYGYALYKLGWCYFNAGDYKSALGSFVKVIQYTNNLKKRGRKRSRVTLKREAQKDLVRVYANLEGANPRRAIGFFRKIAPDDAYDLAERLADLYSLTGQFGNSNKLYRELIKLQPRSYKVVTYQKQIAYNTRNIGKQVETVKEVRRLVSLWSKVKNAKDAKPEKVKKDAKGIEELLRGLATTLHRQALQTKGANDYAIAYELYDAYVKAFPDNENAYVMTFYFAELLYKIKKWEEAARQYQRTLEINPKGEFTKDAAHGQVLAYKKLLDVSQKYDKKAEEVEGPDVDPKKVASKKKSVPKPRKLSENHQRFIKACDLYAKYVQNSEYLVDITYDAARIYYDHNQFDKAAPRFQEISEKHMKHRLAVFAANLLLDIHILLGDYKALNDQVERFLKIYPESRDPSFYKRLMDARMKARFKGAQAMESEKDYCRAAKKFVNFSKEFAKSKYGDKALYNAALNYERCKQMERAIKARLMLVNNYPDSELMPKALFQIGGSLHALAIYSQAARFYEIYAERFPKEENARVALQNAAAFRRGLGEYDKSISDYTTYMGLVGSDRQKAADVFFSIGLIYKDQGKHDKVIKHFGKYIKKYGKSGEPGRILEAYVHIANAYKAKGKRPANRRAAAKAYATTYKIYRGWSAGKKKKISAGGRSAVAEARFSMGEAIFHAFRKVSFRKIKPQRNVKKHVKKVGKILSKKSELIGKAKKIYEEVIGYQAPNWTLAGLARIGQMYQNLGDEVYKLPPPKIFDDDQKEVFSGQMAERAAVQEGKAKNAYITCVKKAQELSWFNEWSELAEKELSRLDSSYRYPAEVRARPVHVDDSAIAQAYIVDLPVEEE